jgi:hypothetical protein
VEAYAKLTLNVNGPCMVKCIKVVGSGKMECILTFHYEMGKVGYNAFDRYYGGTNNEVIVKLCG